MSELSTQTPPPRYLRFVTALLLGAAVTAPVALIVTTSGCLDEGEGRCVSDCSDDQPPPPDARIDSSQVPVDGPLHPPDLPRMT